ncbi:formate dehydrogenase accessory sulfurtransferase FdhD [Methanonatronarchaeum sp. AMET-Sl]|uniref:formate dehydrogenase accessory sulfurtransferase FdhD n=1 Tax=Methanonatronarchaeum sp. AMET-Sl TaxID=3037654 RepID=UPI00244E0C9C|nr:formate dehydrogenase accessory sulfurtransferase FdhD [Methanonatronarchaeum sp. AMET-Sl]WGI17059.1 formate dehydrogenase accessory sulfurtransferase FdhD [Methanonatronarchaeum sp. AMET-Sl]
MTISNQLLLRFLTLKLYNKTQKTQTKTGEQKMYKEKDVIIAGKKQKKKIPIEEPTSLFINGKHFKTFMITPEMKKEFTIGHLICEGLVSKPKEIESIDIEGNEINAILKGYKQQPSQGLIVSGCGGGTNYLDEENLPKIKNTKKFNLKQINQFMIEVLETGKSSGLHSSGIKSQTQNFQKIIKDIGRHNTIDKIVGAAIKQKINLKNCYIVSTGRMSSDMALKCAKAGIPIAGSHRSLTTLAIEIGEKTNLTILGKLSKPKKTEIYTNPNQIK